MNEVVEQQNAAPVEQAPTAPKAEHLDGLAIVAKKEKAIFQKEKQLKEQQKQWEKQIQEWQSKVSTYETREKTWKDNPLKFLEDTGRTYQDLTEKVLSNGELTAKDVKTETEKQLQELRAELERRDKEAKESEAKRLQQEEQATVAAYKDALKGFVADSKDKFKLTSVFDADASLIYDTIETHFDRTSEKDEDGNVIRPGKILSNQEAADLVEKFLQKQLHEGMKALGYQLPGSEPPKEERPEALGGAQIPKSPKTLNNNMSSASSALVSPKTDMDRTARALAAMEAIEKAKQGRR